MRSSPLLHVTLELDYALRSLAELARSGPALTRDDLAQRTDIPPSYLSNVLQKLRRSGLIRRRAGRAGGFELAADATAIGVADVVSVVQGVWSGAPCPFDRDDPIDPLWTDVEHQLQALLARTTVADLARWCDRSAGAVT